MHCHAIRIERVSPHRCPELIRKLHERGAARNRAWFARREAQRQKLEAR